MFKNFTRLLFLTFLCTGIFQLAQAQTVITQWNFNSNPADGSTGTGTLNPSTGSGTLTHVNTSTPTFNNGSGSSDPAASDNSGLGMTGWPAQGTGNKTAGLQFRVSTAGHQNIGISFDLRHSNTGPRHFTIQYTADASAATPVWVEFAIDSTTAGDAFINNRNYNLSSVTALNNNPNAGFRVVATFRPNTSTYVAANPGSNYATTGTWRFDMVTVRSLPSGPVAQSYAVTSSTTSYIKFNQPVTASSASNLSNYSWSPSVTATAASLSASGDTIFLTHSALVDGQPYTFTVSGIQNASGSAMSATGFTAVFNASTPNLVITEIIHSPNDIEMIEVYNAGASAINLGGLKWTNGTTGNFPEVSLAPGATAVFATSPASASSSLNVSPVYTILNGLGSSDDILVIRNSLNQVVDSVSYFVGTNGWPSAPAGVYGYSFELNSASSDNNNGANWTVPQNPVTPQPAQGPVRATPGVYPTPPYTSPTASLSFVGSKVTVGESTTTVTVTANLQGGGSSTTTVDLELLPQSTASSGTDFTLPGSMQLSWPPFSNNVTRSITISISNDVLAENTEYFTLRFVNPVNTSLPPAASNHYSVFIQDNDKTAPVPQQAITLSHIASFSNGAAGTNSAEIVAHDPASQRLFIANSIGARLDIVNFSNPSAATLVSSVPMTPYGNINSIAVRNGIVAAAIENSTPELPGKVVFFDVNGNYLNQVTVGAMPDMIVFSNTGTKVLTANEGQPSANYLTDPEGSVSIIDISGGIPGLTQGNVTTAGFTSFNTQVATLKAAGVRIFGLNNPSVAQDMEPEYVTVSADDSKAWVTCQENNAIAEIDLSTGTITAIRPLGTKDHSLPRNGLDASDQGTSVEIANWPVKGVYMPDAIASYTVGGQTYLVTANEGDAREYSAYEEALRLSSSSYVLDPTVFPNPEALKASIGRLNVTRASGDTDNDGDYDEIHVFGARSFSIWNATTGELVWDSGDELEEITSRHPVFGAIFNASNANNTLKNRSDDKGPEPEGVTLATINGRVYAFIALERIGGCMVYDVTNPASPFFVDYRNTRNVASYGGDNGAEGIVYISAANSPTGSPIVILANEVSSSLTFYTVAGAVLDITLQDIKAANLGSRNQVEWTTADEQPGDEFELQRSRDGVRFEAVATIPARGVASAYKHWDVLPFEGLSYYRLKLKHNSGHFTYSPVVSARMKMKPAFVLVYPNPAQNEITIKLQSVPAANAVVEIVNAAGQLVKHQKLVNQVSSVSIADLAAGVYTLRYRDGERVEGVTLTKQ
jgi:hypothetical protein